jgi:hypothetical protein
MSSSALQELIKAELTMIRRIAEEANNDCLLYFIDMAILEVENNSNFLKGKTKVSTLRRKYLDRQAS